MTSDVFRLYIITTVLEFVKHRIVVKWTWVSVVVVVVSVGDDLLSCPYVRVIGSCWDLAPFGPPIEALILAFLRSLSVGGLAGINWLD